MDEFSICLCCLLNLIAVLRNSVPICKSDRTPWFAFMADKRRWPVQSHKS